MQQSARVVSLLGYRKGGGDLRALSKACVGSGRDFADLRVGAVIFKT